MESKAFLNDYDKFPAKAIRPLGLDLGTTGLVSKHSTTVPFNYMYVVVEDLQTDQLMYQLTFWTWMVHLESIGH